MMRPMLRLAAGMLLLLAVAAFFTPLPLEGKWLVSAILLLAAFAALSWSWTYTPDGRLDYRAALSLHMLFFTISFRPDKDIDYKMPVPINMIYMLDGLLPRARVHRTEDITIAHGDVEVPARIYWPVAHKETRPPLIVYFHGGGFVMGSVAIFDKMVRAIAVATGAIIVSVDYRLAPRHPFPAAVDDACGAAAWAGANAERLGADPSRIFVGGDSAGGNLATVACLRLRDAGGPAVAGQILFYPACELANGDDAAGNLESPDSYGLPLRSIRGFTGAYVGAADNLADPYMSPVNAPDLSGLPPVLLATAGFDPLTASSLVYAQRLRDAGVAVEHLHFPEMIHGFAGVGLFPQQRDLLDKTAEFVKDAGTRSRTSSGLKDGQAPAKVPIIAN